MDSSSDVKDILDLGGGHQRAVTQPEPTKLSKESIMNPSKVSQPAFYS